MTIPVISFDFSSFLGFVYMCIYFGWLWWWEISSHQALPSTFDRHRACPWFLQGTWRRRGKVWNNIIFCRMLFLFFTCVFIAFVTRTQPTEPPGLCQSIWNDSFPVFFWCRIDFFLVSFKFQIKGSFNFLIFTLKRKGNLPLPGKEIVVFKHFNNVTFHCIDFYRKAQACFRKGHWF